MTRILVVDDERLLVKGLKRSLEAEGYEVLVAYDGTEALALLKSEPVDLVLLDIMLPRIDGLEVCRHIRRISGLPIIMLSARGDDVDKIVGLELGADDYLAKPFNSRELIARIKAVLRRAQPAPAGTVAGPGREYPAGARDYPGALPAPESPGIFPAGQVIRAGGLEIDPPRQRVTVHGEKVSLTAREFDLIYTLARHPGRIFTRDILLEQVWGTRYFGDPRVVDVYMRRLRQKIEPDPANPRWLMTRWGTGYYFSGG